MTHLDQETLDGVDLDQDSPWQDEDVLRALYVDGMLGANEIAELLGCSNYTIHNWLTKHEIETRSASEAAEVAMNRREERLAGDERNPSLLNELYWGEGMSIHEIADHIGAGHSTVHRNMERYGIERRDRLQAIRDAYEGTIFRVGPGGYERIELNEFNERKCVRHHRLIAVAHHGFDAVCDKVIHHENHIPWDNRPENLRIMTHSEHSRLHNSRE